jgi:hypothetical protein
MSRKLINNIANEWHAKTEEILELKELSLTYLQTLLNKTYKMLFDFKNDKVIPKELARVLVNMEEFFWFLSFVGEKEGMNISNYYQELHSISKTLKESYFNDDFKEKYPKLLVNVLGEEGFVFDFEKDLIEILAEYA